MRVIGCGIEMREKNKKLSNFDINNLNYNKIIICTDADELFTSPVSEMVHGKSL